MFLALATDLNYGIMELFSTDTYAQYSHPHEPFYIHMDVQYIYFYNRDTFKYIYPGLVVPRRIIETTSGHTVRLAGSKVEEEQWGDCHTVVTGGEREGGLRSQHVVKETRDAQVG